MAVYCLPPCGISPLAWLACYTHYGADDMAETLLNIDALSVQFGGVRAVDAVSFTLTEGELLGLIGPNGAGKTTLLRAITGVVKPQRGKISLAGQNLDGLSVPQRIRSGLGLAQQLVRPFCSMTVQDNVALAAGSAKTARPWRALLSMSRRREREQAMELLALVGIQDAASSFPDALPLGYRKRLELARALALQPRLLLLDEPLAGLNHTEAGRLADTIQALNQRGQSMVLIEHNLKEVMRICPRLIVQDQGRKIADGPAAAVMQDSAVRTAYLGDQSRP